MRNPPFRAPATATSGSNRITRSTYATTSAFAAHGYSTFSETAKSNVAPTQPGTALRSSLLAATATPPGVSRLASNRAPAAFAARALVAAVEYLMRNRAHTAVTTKHPNQIVDFHGHRHSTRRPAPVTQDDLPVLPIRKL
jgi:hypothetical protein